jgi:hypothetical protein
VTDETRRTDRSEDAVNAQFDRFLGALGVGEMRAEIRNQGALLKEVRDELHNAPRFDPRVCRDQDKEISNIKTTLFGPYDEPGGLVVAMANQQARTKLLLWLVVFAATTAGGTFAYGFVELIIWLASRH